MTNARLLRGESTDDGLRLAATGAWTAAHAGQLETEIGQFLEQAQKNRRVIIEMGAVTEFDTFGAWLLERLRRELGAGGKEVEINGLPASNSALFTEMEKVNRVTRKAAAGRFSIKRMLAVVGRSMVEFVGDLRAFAHMFGQVVAASGRVLQQPARFRFTSAVHQLDRVGLQAVPIIILITFLIGSIIAQQGFFHFSKFGADLYVVDMVGILVLREIGVLLVAIMVAGRSGSSYTAELGSMKMREEVDALHTMGFDPVEVLILPRILVLIIALPMLTFLGDMAAIYGGSLVAEFYGGMSPELFVARLKEAISLTHFKVGIIKAPFMGAVIGIIACTEGLRVQGSADSLGRQTTKSVVKSIFMVIVLDGLFAMFFASIGM